MPIRGFLKSLALVLLLAYAQLFTLVWPVATVGLYFLAVGGGVIGGE